MSFTYGLDSRLRGNNERTLTIRVHCTANPRSNRVVAHLLEKRNAAQITCLGTKINLVCHSHN